MTGRSGDGTLLDSEYSLVKNPDFISYFFWENFQDFIGKWNIYLDGLNEIMSRGEGLIAVLKGYNYPKIGPIVIDGSVVSVKQHEIYRDRVEVLVELTIPAPMNNIQITLSFAV